jgi:hypothetical protein
MLVVPLSLAANNSAALTRNRLHFFFSFIEVRREKAFRHLLHAGIVVIFHPLILRDIELQKPVLRRTVPALAHVAKLNALPSSILRVEKASSRKPDRIPGPLLRQPPASLGISQVAKILQFFL